MSNNQTNEVTPLSVSKPLLVLGAIGIALAAVVAAVIVVRGNTLIEPEGYLTKSLTFDLAVGIYYLTLAFYLPLANFSKRGQAIWLGAAFLFTLYGYSIETVQIFRGIDPRFSEASSTADDIAGGLFGLAAVGQIVVFAVLAQRFFRQAASHLVLGIRYAAASVGVAFAAGIWMSVIEGRVAGEEGNLLVMHAMGFHALQAIPFLAWLLERAPAVANARLRLHAGGLAWLGACFAVAGHTAAGLSPSEVSPGLVVAALLILAWAGVTVSAFQTWLREVRGEGLKVPQVAS